ncbi:MAG: DUF4097 family beta strand repeat protein [Chloroflexi bacterium]|nr:DUF4097 family beta strand repeat protein [Chloroflexota bacterium]
MFRQSFEISTPYTLIIGACSGDLNIMAGVQGRAEVLCDNAAVNCNYNPETRTLKLGALYDDTMVRLPSQGDVRIAAVSGDLSIHNLEGNVTVGDISGDMLLRRATGTVTVGSVSGDLKIDQAAALVIEGGLSGDLVVRRVGSVRVGSISGDLRAEEIELLAVEHSVSGDVRAERVSGDISIGGCRGDVRLSAAAGNIRIEGVSGDVVLEGISGNVNIDGISGDVMAALDPHPGSVCRLEAHGDIRLRLAQEASARLLAQAPHGEVVVRLPLAIQEHDETQVRGQTGAGESDITVASLHGDVLVEGGRSKERRSDEERHRMREERHRQHEERHRMREEQRVHKEAFKTGLSDLIAKELEGIAAGFKASGRRTRRLDDETEAQSGGPANASEERMMIMRMLAEGRIDVQEADRLLRALE